MIMDPTLPGIFMSAQVKAQISDSPHALASSSPWLGAQADLPYATDDVKCAADPGLAICKTQGEIILVLRKRIRKVISESRRSCKPTALTF